MKKIISIFLLVSIFFFLYTNPIIIKYEIKQIVYLWFDKIFINLFIYFIIIDLLLNLNINNLIGKIFFKIFNKLFNLSNYNSSFIFFLSFFIGSPLIHKYIYELVENNTISKTEADYLIKITSNTNPLFTLNILNKNIGIFFLLSQYITNIIIGLIYKPKNTFKLNINNFNTTKKTTLTNSIKNNIDILFNILGIMILFTVIISFFKTLNIPNIFLIPLELLNGINIINKLEYQKKIKYILIQFIIVFGGFSIHNQIKTVTENFINYKSFLFSKILSSIISILVFIILYNFF